MSRLGPSWSSLDLDAFEIEVQMPRSLRSSWGEEVRAAWWIVDNGRANKAVL